MKYTISNEMAPKKCLRNDRGITLVALMITIILIMILGSLAVTTTTTHFENIRKSGYFAKLEMAQEAIEKIKNTDEHYTDSNGNTVYVKNLGTAPTAEQRELITSKGCDSSKFTYYTQEQVEKDLGISGLEMSLLIDFEDVIAIDPVGLEIDGTTYHMLSDDGKYKIAQNTTKNTQEVNFTWTVEAYTDKSYKVTVTPTNVGDITKGVVQYKLASLEYWNSAEDNQFVVQRLGQYDIRYTDANNNTKTVRVEIKLNNSNNPVAEEVEE